MVLRSKESLMWLFLHRSLKKKTYGDKLSVVQETKDGFIICIYAMNQKNSRMEVHKEEAFKVFVDYDLHKGRPKPHTTEEYTKSRQTFFNSIQKCRCIPDGKFEVLNAQQLIDYGVQCREHYRYFKFSCHKKLKPRWPIGSCKDDVIDDDDEEMETYQSADFSINSGVNYNVETVVKKCHSSVDCLRQICEDVGIISDSSLDGETDAENFKAAARLINLPGCRNSPEVKINKDINNNNTDTSYQKEEALYADQRYNNAQILLNEMGLIARKLASINTVAPNRPSQESSVGHIFVDDLLSGPMQKIDPDIFLNLEPNRMNLYADLPKEALGLNVNDNLDNLTLEDIVMEIPRMN